MGEDLSFLGPADELGLFWTARGSRHKGGAGYGISTFATRGLWGRKPRRVSEKGITQGKLAPGHFNWPVIKGGWGTMME